MWVCFCVHIFFVLFTLFQIYLINYKFTANVQIKPNEVMEVGARVYVPVSVAETRISKRFDSIPSGTLYPNADEIEYLQRLVMYKACPVKNATSAFYVIWV